MTTHETNSSGTQPKPAAPLTQGDIPALVQAVTATLQEKLKEKCPPPPADNDDDKANESLGGCGGSSKLLPMFIAPALFS